MEIPRRRLLAVGGITALGGCSGQLFSDSEDGTPTGNGSLPAGLIEALDPLPASVDDRSLSRLVATAPSSDRGENFNQVPGVESVSQLGLDPDQVDWMASGAYSESRRNIVTVVGSFEADRPTLPEADMPSGSIDRSDGRLILARSPQPSEASTVRATATDAIDGDLSLSDDVRLALTKVSDARYLIVTPSFNGAEQTMYDRTVDGLQSAVFGISRHDQLRIRVDAAGTFTDASAYEREAFVDLVTGVVQRHHTSVTVERDDRVAVASFTASAPTQEVRERQPDIMMTTTYSSGGAAELAVQIRNTSETPIDPSTLTVLVDDEPRDGVFDGHFAPGEPVSIEADPLSVVAVEWADPQTDYEVVLSTELVVDGVTFEDDYERATQSLTMTYTGETTLTDLEQLAVEVYSGESESTYDDSERQFTLSERHETLDAGDTISVPDVSLGDRVAVTASYEYENGNKAYSGETRIHTFHTRAPGSFTFQHEDESALVYEGDPVDPGNYEVTVGGQRPETTLTDAHETLEDGDRLPIDGEAGAQVVVAWVGEGGRSTVYSGYIRPSVEFVIVRSRDTLTLAYRGDETFDADAFAVQVGHEDLGAVFAEEDETLEDGDTVSVDLPEGPWSTVVRWTELDESLVVSHSSPHDMLQFQLEGASLTFVGRGEWPSGEFEITVDGESVTGFGDTATKGDTVDLGADTGSDVTVTWHYDGGTTYPVFSGTINPPVDFGFEYDEPAGQLTITSVTPTSLDASILDVHFLGESRDTYPYRWAGAYDTVEKGDSITVAVPESAQDVVVEYPKWDESTVYSLDENRKRST